MQTILLFGSIGTDVTAAGFKETLDRLNPAAPITLQINSPGGCVQDACVIYSLLSAWPGGVTVDVVGWAVSAASFVAMAGRRIRMAPSSLLMVHSPWVTTSGNAADLRATASTLDVVAETLIKAYGRSGQSPKTVRSWMGEERWFSADEAISAGLADEILAGAQVTELLDPESVLNRHTPSANIRQRIYAMSTTPIRAQADTDDIVASYALMTKGGRNEALQPIFMNALQDKSITPQDFNQRMLAAMAEGAGPVAGWYTPNDHASSPLGFMGARRSETFLAAASDVLLARANIPVQVPHPAAKDLSRMSISTMAEQVLLMNGISTRDKKSAEIIQAAMTTSDFPQLLANVTGRSLRAGYDSAPATHAVWTGEREVADFKPQSLLALSEAPGLEKVLEYGEYRFGIFSEGAETFSVETFGRLVQISRQALINDDLGAFTRIPLAYGASARRLEADLVYGKLISNPVLSDGVALFHANHGNLAGTGAALSVDSLGAARAAMRRQKGTAGLEYIDPQPAFLIVPVTLETKAEALLASLSDPAALNSGASNPDWIRRLTLVADPRLDAASLTSWYLACNPNQIETVVRAYLQGQERPYIEENDEFVRDAITHKCRLDIGVGAIDHRGLYKNPGA